MRLRDFKEGDLKGEWAEGFGAESIREDSVRMTVIDGDEVVALGGAVVNKEVMFWMQVKKRVKRTVALVKAVKESIEIIMKTLGVDRATALVREDFISGHRTVQLLGFKLTGESAMYDGIIYDWYEIWLK